MHPNKISPTADKSIHIVSSELLQTKSDYPLSHEKSPNNDVSKKKKSWYTKAAPIVSHYVVLCLLGLLLWGWLWLSWGDGWSIDGPWFRLGSVVVTAWASGLVLQSVTTLPPLLGALLTGILARNLHYLDMRDFTHIDVFLRKIYPVIILGKGSLGWNLEYMVTNWKRVISLGAVPWTLEVVTLATCTHFLLGHPWLWGLVLGTFYASVSGPVVMSNVVQAGSNPLRSQNWPQLVATAGGTDTALSVGMFGVLFSFLFSDPGLSETYKYFKAFSSLFIGVAVGVAWGTVAGFLPHTKDTYLVELRVLFVLFGAIFFSFATSYLGWGGVAGVAVLACNATAAHHWKKTGWRLNDNPASTAYRVMWSACEPAVFAYTGTFFVFNSSIARTFQYGFAILVLCLVVRLGAACLMCWDMTVKEKAFICCVWSTKSIVEAVIGPTAINTLIERDGAAHEMTFAEDFVTLIVQEILITTPIAFLLTKFAAPKLLKDKSSEHKNGESNA